MEKGLSFLEFNYMIMQSYDFYYLYKNYDCNFQFGGNDQWSNMLGGTELIRRKLGKDAHAMTITLLLNSEGKKMGKTASGAVWLDPNKTSPYDFYQYWRNVGDDDVLKCIRMLTFLPLEQIDAMDSWEGSQLNTAKEILAYELTKLVHGEEEAEKAQSAAKALFASGGDAADMPATELTEADLKDGTIQVADLLVLGKMAPSKGEAKRLIQQGGILVDDAKVDSFAAVVTLDQMKGDGIVIKKGKKTYRRFSVK
ncbi:MAG: tyrosine--tRNA ligase, partial [Clostridia bacterium]|nr:tyrosine--tRNA ligase [Clostridia bacterium]